MKEMPYEDGYKMGVTIAENCFKIWQDEKAPPIPWPKVSSKIRDFVKATIPIMNQAFKIKFIQDTRKAGLDPENIRMPRVFLDGIEEGYCNRLAELLHKFVNPYASVPIPVMVVPPHASPVRRFAPDTPFVLARARVPTDKSGLARNDGTFTESPMDIGENVVMFASANAAIAWAEASPRHWEVVNKAMF